MYNSTNLPVRCESMIYKVFSAQNSIKYTSNYYMKKKNGRLAIFISLLIKSTLSTAANLELGSQRNIQKFTANVSNRIQTTKSYSYKS